MADMQKSNVLVVDDDPNTRGLLVDALAILGCDARRARNGEEALAAVADSKPDAIILDLLMPTMNGFSVVAKLHRQDRQIPIILLSGIVHQARHADRLPGVVGVLNKADFSMEKFKGLLQRAGIATLA